MKQLLLISCLSLTLTACATSLNPFSDSEPEQVAMDVTAPAPAKTNVNVNAAVLETELSELELLTGSRPRVQAQAPKQAPLAIDATVEELMDEIKGQTTVANDVPTAPKAEAVEPAIAKIAPKAIDEQKPATVEIKKEKPIEKQTILAAAVPKTTIEKASAPQIVEQKPKTPTAPQPIMQKTAVAPVQTIEEPIFSEKDLKLSSATGCPKIQIMPSARSITYFEKNMAGNVTARAVINEIRGGCEITRNGLEIDLDILMNGRITNKGRFEGQKDKEAFMTFPYFVSVATPQGLPVDKQILATAMRFRPSVNHLNHAEKITQTIPMKDFAQAANYKIVIGYQLNRQQLEYNRAQKMMRANNTRISPDTSPARRVSRNPLKE